MQLRIYINYCTFFFWGSFYKYGYVPQRHLHYNAAHRGAIIMKIDFYFQVNRNPLFQQHCTYWWFVSSRKYACLHRTQIVGTSSKIKLISAGNPTTFDTIASTGTSKSGIFEWGKAEVPRNHNIFLYSMKLCLLALNSLYLLFFSKHFTNTPTLRGVSPNHSWLLGEVYCHAHVNFRYFIGDMVRGMESSYLGCIREIRQKLKEVRNVFFSLLEVKWTVAHTLGGNLLSAFTETSAGQATIIPNYSY